MTRFWITLPQAVEVSLDMDGPADRATWEKAARTRATTGWGRRAIAIITFTALMVQPWTARSSA